MRREDDNMGTHTHAVHDKEEDAELHKLVEQNNKAPTDVVPSPDQVIQTEPNILDILNDE